jgi:hypothetical protein
MGGGKGGGGSTNNYAAAQQEAASNEKMNTQQTWANRPEFTTPWGQQTWASSSAVDPSTGQPVTKWSSNIDLSPQQQQALDSQMAIQEGRSGAAQTLLDQATGAFQKPFDWSSLPGTPANTTDAANKAYQNMVGYAAPTRERQQKQLEAKLLNMGAARGSEAFKNATSDQADQFTRENQAFQTAAGGEGRADMATAQAQRQQAINEQIQQRGMTLNELNALLSGEQVGMPNMPDFKAAGKSQGANLLAANQADQAQQASQGMDWGTLAGTAGSIALVAL